MTARVGVLGPLTLTVDGAPVEVTRAKVRAALSLFVAHDGAPINVDVLIDHLWPDDIPKDPRAALSVVLSRLRSVFGPARDDLVSSAGGHQLTIGSDLADFRSLIAKARQATDRTDMASLLDQALLLWRDEPFTGGVTGPHIESVATGLVEERWNAITLRTEALFELGLYEELVSFSLPLATEQPHREQLVATCARALGLRGRKTDALRLIERSRNWLRDEMGLDSGATLNVLEQDLLRGAVDLVQVATTLGHGDAMPTFVGREAELAALQSSTGLALVTGEPGIGKTALVQQAIAQWQADGQRVLSLRVGATSSRPMEALVELFEELIALSPPTSDDSELWVSLARVVPSVPRPQRPSLSAVTKDTVIASLADYIERCATATNAVIVLDDVQWLDLASVELVARLAQSGKVRIVAAARSDGTSNLQRWLSDDDLRIALSPLSASHVEQIVDDTLHPRHHQISQQLWNRTGGNPLFLRLLVDLIQDGVDITTELPSSVLIAVQQRLQGLSKRALTSLERAALLGSSFSLATLRQLAPTADADLDEFVALGLVTVDRVADTGEFQHALVRDGVYDLIPEGHRVSLHDQVGQILEFSGAPASSYVAHYEAADSFDPLRSARALFDAASEFAAIYAWDDVHALVSRAVEAYVPTGDRRLDAQLAVLDGNAQRDLHHVAPDTALRAALDTARDLGDAELFAEAVIALSIHGWRVDTDEALQTVQVIDEALGLDISDKNRILICSAGAALMPTKHHERGRALFHEAFDAALRDDDADVQARVLENAHWGLSHPEDLATLEEATRLFRDVSGDDLYLRWSVAATEFRLGIIAVKADQALAALQELRTIADDFGPSVKDWELAHTEAAYAQVQGDLEVAMAHLERSRELGEQTSSPTWVLPIYGASLVGIMRSQGRHHEALPFIDGAIAANPDFPAWRAVAASAAASAGDLARARTELDVAFGDYAALRPSFWTAAALLLTDAVCALDDVVRANELYDVMAPFSGRMSWNGVSSYGPLDDGLAALAELRGDEPAAQRHRKIATAATNEFAPPSG